MEEVILALMQLFKDKEEMFTDATLTPIQHIDKWRGQALDPASFEMYNLPALFYDWRITWNKQGKKWVGLITWEFHLQLDPTWETSSISTNFEEGIRQVLYHTFTRLVLDGFSTENSTKLQRVDEVPMDVEVTNYHKLRYECDFHDPMSDSNYVSILIEKLLLAGHLKKTL